MSLLDAEKLVDGEYTVQYDGDNPCKGVDMNCTLLLAWLESSVMPFDLWVNGVNNTFWNLFIFQKNGIYAGKYLSYELYGKSTPGRVRLQSAKAKRPMTWEVKTLSGNRVTLEAVRPIALYCMLWMSTNFRKWDHGELVALCFCRPKEQVAVRQSCRTWKTVSPGLWLWVAEGC